MLFVIIVESFFVLFLFQRTCVFKFFGAIAVDLGKDRVGPYLITIIAALSRELNSTYADQGKIPQFKTFTDHTRSLLHL